MIVWQEKKDVLFVKKLREGINQEYDNFIIGVYKKEKKHEESIQKLKEKNITRI